MRRDGGHSCFRYRSCLGVRKCTNRRPTGRFQSPAPVTILDCDGDAMEPFLSRDGAILFFNNRNDPPDQTDLHWAERIDDLTFRYRGRIEGANSAHLDDVPTMARNGRFCFVSPRAYEQTLATLEPATPELRASA